MGNIFDSFDSLIDQCVTSPTRIGPYSFIRSGTVIYSGSNLERAVDIAHNVQLREECSIGEKTRILTGTQIMAAAHVGRGCRLAGTVCNRSYIGHGASVLGHLMHRFKAGLPGYIEPSPRVGDGVLIGRESSVIGGVVVGDYAVIGAGAVVTRDIPTATIWAQNPAIQIGIRNSEEVSSLAKLIAAHS
ncbi:acyltransferase [Nonomuraea sp. NPDC050022]|uniref:acyltransferase n=1 Tax=unclassified Nonomuraea TaxID=2593643 RepID=UPI0033FB4D68